MLSSSLYSNMAYENVLYACAPKVKNGEIFQTAHGDDYFKARFGRRSLTIETREPISPA